MCNFAPTFKTIHTIIINFKQIIMKKFYFFMVSMLLCVLGASAQTETDYAITGDYNGWSGTNETCIKFYTTDTDGVYEATAAEFKTGQWGFKVRKGDGWENLYGTETPIIINGDAAVIAEDKNIYLNETNMRLVLTNAVFTLNLAGAAPTLAVSCDSFEERPDITLVGSQVGWGWDDGNGRDFTYVGNSTYTLTLGEKDNFQFKGSFKIVKNKTWSPSTELGGSADGMNVNSDGTFDLVWGGKNVSVPAGYYFQNAVLTVTLKDAGASLKVDGTYTKEGGEVKYTIVGTQMGWDINNGGIDFQQVGDNVYKVEMETLTNDFKIVRNRSWDGAYGMEAGKNTNIETGTYTLKSGGENITLTSGLTIKNAVLTLNVPDNADATLTIEGIKETNETFSLVGDFQSWNPGSAPQFVNTVDDTWILTNDDFPGNKYFKISINKAWDCFLAQAQDGVKNLANEEEYTCARANNDNNFVIGEDGASYTAEFLLKPAADRQSALLKVTYTDNATGITKVFTSTTGKTYNLNGMEVEAKQKGIYIQDGKKFVIK